jgi:5-methylcytosine-specific restriction endonuclease McrA
MRLWREKNRDLLRERDLEYSRKWREANREKTRAHIRASMRKYRAANPEKGRIYKQYRRAKKAGNGGVHTSEDIRNLLIVQNGRCAGCARKFTKLLCYSVDHVIPLSKGGTNSADNIQLLCVSCNSSKCAMSPEQWAQRIGRLFV